MAECAWAWRGRQAYGGRRRLAHELGDAVGVGVAVEVAIAAIAGLNVVVPAVSVEVVNAAWPALSVTVASVWLFVASVKVTEPVGVPDPGAAAVTFTVKVTG